MIVTVSVNKMDFSCSVTIFIQNMMQFNNIIRKPQWVHEYFCLTIKFRKLLIRGLVNESRFAK
jgi:hypothetical protein